MEFKIKENKLCLYHQNQLLVENICCYLEHQEKIIAHSNDDWKIIKQESQMLAISSNCKITLKNEENGVKFQVEFENDVEDFLSVSHFCCFKGLYHQNINKCLINHFVYANGNMVNEMQSTLEVFTLLSGKQVMSADNVSFIDENGKNGIFGLITYKEYFNQIYCSHDGTLKCYHLLENHSVLKKEVVKSDWLYLGFFDDIAYKGLPNFAKIIAKNMNVSLKNTTPPVGYCTWYYYLFDINENKFYENLNYIHQQTNYPIRYIQLDDGWQICWGNWYQNQKFSNLKQLATDVKKLGYKPGLWFAPFGVANESEVYQKHRDWFVKNWDNDEIYGIPSLDFSHPEVKKFIYDLFYDYSHNYGFEYFKLDIISSRLAPGRHYDPHFNTIKNLREGFRIIKEAIGEKGEILACTCPLAPVAGLCDFMRISGDVFGSWESLVYIFNSTLKRYYLNQNLYINDADCVIIRKPENEDEECRHHCYRNDDEITTYLSLIAASGGAIMLSDKLKNLNENQLQFIDKLFPNVSFSAIPMDLMDSHLISKLDFYNIKDIHVYILVNWEEKEKTFEIPVKHHHVYSFWDNRYEGIFDENYHCTIKPHCCKVLQISPVKSISVIGTNATIRPIINQMIHSKGLKAEFIKNNEQQYIYSEQTLKPQKNLKRINQYLYQIVNLKNQREYILEIEK